MEMLLSPASQPAGPQDVPEQRIHSVSVGNSAFEILAITLKLHSLCGGNAVELLLDETYL